MQKKQPSLWLTSFVVALAVLLFLKLGLVINSIVGTEGFAPAYRMLPKSLLFLGYDVVGAALWASVVTLICAPLGRRPAVRTTIAVGLQVTHAFAAWCSFMTFLTVGSPLSRESLAVAILDQPSGPESAPIALWSSLTHIMTPWVISTFVVAVGATGVLTLYAPRLIAKMGRRTRRALLTTATLAAITTTWVLPLLINGSFWGHRVYIHTWGLERSPVVHLAWSYVKPVLGVRRARDLQIEDPFHFDLSSPFPPETPLDNPLLKAQPRRTNILYISLESIGQLYVEDKPDMMPTLTTFGRQPGRLLLRNHQATWPQTMKAFFAIFCAELPYPSHEPITYINPAIPCRSLSEVLHDNGYYTALITSADLAFDRKMRFFQHRDFDRVWDMRNMPGHDDESVWRDSWGLDERLAVKNITDVMSQADKRPFFIFYEMAVAHHPYYGCEAHENDPLPTRRENYHRAAQFVDARIADLLGAVDKLGIADETLVVVVSDHAEGFGQHPGSLSHGTTVYRENIWVPMGLMGPQIAQLSGTLDFATSHIDIAPTLLGLVGLEAPCTMKGRDLTRTRRPDMVLFGGRPPGGHMGLMDGRFKYILEENGGELLFDVVDDPPERTNRVGDFPARVRAYRKRINNWRVFGENLIERYAEILRESTCRPQTQKPPNLATP